MHAQLLTSYKTPEDVSPYTLSEIPLPELTDPNDLLIKVTAASYCHTDAVLSFNQMPHLPPSFPHISSHEFAGTVLAHHSQPSESAKSYIVGTRLGVPGRSFHPCGKCTECLQLGQGKYDEVGRDEPGYSVYCPHALNNGLSRAGGFAEYAVVDARQVVQIPENMSAVETAPLMCAGITIYAALKRCGLKKGERVAIMGAGGGLGHLGCQFAVHMGLKVVAVDVSDSALSLVRSLKNTKARIIDARTQTAESVVQELGEEDDGIQETQDMGVDAVIILPESQQAFDYGIKLLKRHGLCIVVSFPENGFHISANDVVFRDIRIQGSLVGSNACLKEMIEFAAEKGVRAKLRTFALEDLNGLVAEYRRGVGGKLVVDMEMGRSG